MTQEKIIAQTFLTISEFIISTHNRLLLLEAASASAAGRSPVSAPATGSADTPTPGAGQLGHSADGSDSGTASILPCPFCGQPGIVQKGRRHSNGEWVQLPWVWCKPCGVVKNADTDEEALIKWNTRAGLLKAVPDALPRAGQACPPNDGAMPRRQTK